MKRSKSNFKISLNVKKNSQNILYLDIYQYKKLNIIQIFGTVWPKIRKTGFFGRNPALSVFIIYGPQTSCQKSEKSLEPFSSNMGITLLLGPFWAIRPLKYHISAHFGKTGFFPEKRPCTFLALIVVNFHAKY